VGVGEAGGAAAPDAAADVAADGTGGDAGWALKQAVTRTVEATMTAAISWRRGAGRWGTLTVSGRLAAACNRRVAGVSYGVVEGRPFSVVPLTSIPNQRDPPAPRSS